MPRQLYISRVRVLTWAQPHSSRPPHPCQLTRPGRPIPSTHTSRTPRQLTSPGYLHLYICMNIYLLPQVHGAPGRLIPRTRTSRPPRPRPVTSPGCPPTFKFAICMFVFVCYVNILLQHVTFTCRHVRFGTEKDRMLHFTVIPAIPLPLTRDFSEHKIEITSKSPRSIGVLCMGPIPLNSHEIAGISVSRKLKIVIHVSHATEIPTGTWESIRYWIPV